MFWQSKKSISYQFSVSVIGVVTCVILVFATILILNTRKRLENELERRVEQAFHIAQKNLAIPLWEINTAHVNEYAETLFQDESIEFVHIFDTAETISVKKVKNEFYNSPWSFFQRSSYFITRDAEIMYRDTRVGTIMIAASKKHIRVELWKRMEEATILML